MKTDRPTDPVNPSHYRSGGEETIDKIRRMLGDERFIGFCLGNAIKYRDRAGKKGDADTDLRKALWYDQMASHVENPMMSPDPRTMDI